MPDVCGLSLQPYVPRCIPINMHQAVIAMVAATMSPGSALSLNGRSYVNQDSVYIARVHVESALLSAPPLATPAS